MLTGVILARNEEQNIVSCLRALERHVDELILIDMESGDRTVELARPYIDKLLTHPLVPNFDSARNLAIPEASFDWLWFVDADERISERTGRIVNDLISLRSHEFEAITIPFKSYFCGQWMRHCGWWPGYTMPRVLKRGRFRFREQLHGGVEVQGRQICLPTDPELAIDHFSYLSIEHYLEKLNRYTSTEARQLAESGARWDWRQGVRHMAHELWLSYERNQGVLDRERGWALCWLGGQYRWLTHAKLLDLTGPPPDATESPDVPASLDDVLQLIQNELSGLRASKPSLPLGIVWRSPVYDYSGYAEESRLILKVLATSDRVLKLDELRWSEKRVELSPAARGLFRALERVERPKFTAAITNCIPALAEPDPRASLNILRTTFETDRIPEHWHSHLAKFDEIWVISRHNERAFRASGVPPEKLRVVPSFVDTDVYTPDGERIPLPKALEGRFVFLAVFDWQLRKGWDVLLRGYARAFGTEEKVGLLMKITRSHGHSLEQIFRQADGVLAEFGQSIASRSDIVLWDVQLAETEMSALYRSVDAFVLPSRGEGWGRPYMEAMAAGLPTIGTGASGNIDFMIPDNSLLLPTCLVDVPPAATAEIPVYAGQKWHEPDNDALVAALKSIRHDDSLRRQIGAQASNDVRCKFGMKAGAQAIEKALAAAEQRFTTVSLPAPRADQVRVTIEGEFFALHSFSLINEQLTREFLLDDALAVAVERRTIQPTFDHEIPNAHQIRPTLLRQFDGGPHITIRHAFPPNWDLPEQGRWVHIQPWEYGHLPKEWLGPLRDSVDEIWAPSSFVRDVYIRSGVSSNKIHVIPWGIDPEVFSPAAPPLFLPTCKAFRFLFVGGTIPRKGIDVLLEAYLKEFTRDDDVCLVVKDMGTQSFYRDCNFRQQILEAAANSTGPEIVYLDSRLTAGQLASLYTACHCLTAPYRGEGFGLPILEAMACGLMPIVPSGGPSDDFTCADTACRLPSRVVLTTHSWELCGPATELNVSVADLRDAMRAAYADRAMSHRKGVAASRCVRAEWTWTKTAARMSERIRQLAADESLAPIVHPCNGTSNLPRRAITTERPSICAYLAVSNDERTLADTLCRVVPFVDQVVVELRASTDRSGRIAQEYGATVAANGISQLPTDWVLCLHPGERPAEVQMGQLRNSLCGLLSNVSAAAVQLHAPGKGAAMCRPELRLFRNLPGLVQALGSGAALTQFVARNGRQQAAIDLTIASSRYDAACPPAVVDILEPWLKPWVPSAGDVFVDVGANIGLWSKWLAHGYRRVHAIEPNPDALGRLRAALPENVVVHEVGAWDSDGPVRFTQFNASVHMTAYFQDEGINTGSRRGEITLECRTIDSFDIRPKVDFLKCDTEGAEIRCLQGANRLIARDRPRLLIECHSAENFQALERLLQEWRYEFTVVRDPHYPSGSRHWHDHCWFAGTPMK